VVFAGNVTSKECEYCGAPRQRGGVHRGVERVPVDGVLPFQVEQKAAATALSEWVRSRWFAPNEFLRRGVDGRFSGSYLPYWTYDAMTASWYVGERGEHYYVTVERNNQKVQERRTRWYPASGSFSRFFDDVMVCASTGLPDGVVRALEPWPLERVVPYTQQLLAGYGAKTYDLSVADGFKEAKQRMDAALRQEAARRIGGDDQRVHSVRTRYEALTFKHLLLPVWMSDLPLRRQAVPRHRQRHHRRGAGRAPVQRDQDRAGRPGGADHRRPAAVLRPTESLRGSLKMSSCRGSAAETSRSSRAPAHHGMTMPPRVRANLARSSALALRTSF
jgi:hypothetical protein